MPGRHERDVAAELAERSDGLGRASGRAAFAFQYEAANGLVDRGEVPVQKLLELMGLGRDANPFAQLLHGLLCGRPVAAGTGDQPPVVTGERQALTGKRFGDRGRKPSHVLASQGSERGNGAGV